MGLFVKLHIDKIGDEGLDWEEPIEASWLKEALGARSPYAASKPGRFAVHLTRVNETVHMRGSLELVLDSVCGRCLCAVSTSLTHPVEMAMLPKVYEASASEDGEVADEDVGVGVYDHDEIDMGAVIRDEVFLELPMHVVCSETCAGLCVECGKNLNEGLCGCGPAVDFRWSALKDVKPH
jgi:uncharacterized protein